MLTAIRRLAALVLLLFMPLQGIASTLLALSQCPPADSGTELAYGSDRNDSQERHDDGAGKLHDHTVCHQTAMGMPAISAAGIIPDLPVFVTSISLLSSLFLPEQPQRPPFSVSV